MGFGKPAANVQTMDDGRRRRLGAETDLPPGFDVVVLRESKDALEHAVAVAAESGAGTLVQVGRFDLLELALVLEPDEPLSGARRVLYAAMNAMGDALAAVLPPEKPVSFEWPDTIRIDGGVVGGARLVWPESASEDDPPAWLVAAMSIRIVLPLAGGAVNPYDVTARDGTSLEIEGIEQIESRALMSSFCRYLLLQLDGWRETGFDHVARAYLSRLPHDRARRRVIADNGDLVECGVDRGHEIARSGLAAALGAPRWRDPHSGEPWI